MKKEKEPEILVLTTGKTADPSLLGYFVRFFDEKSMTIEIRNLFEQGCPNIFSEQKERERFDDEVHPKILPIYQKNPYLFLQAMARDSINFPNDPILRKAIGFRMFKSVKIILELLTASKSLKYFSFYQEKRGKIFKNIINHKVCGETYLHIAAKWSEKSIFSFLKIGIDIDVLNEDGETSLQVAARRGFLIGCKYLVEARSDVNARNKRGETALHIAIEERANIEIVNYLLSVGADPYIRDSKGNNSFHVAAIRAHINSDIWKNFNFLVENNERNTALSLVKETVRNIENHLKKSEELNKWQKIINQGKQAFLEKMVKFGELQAQNFEQKIQDIGNIPKKSLSAGLRQRKSVIFRI